MKKPIKLKSCPFCGKDAKHAKYPSGMTITGCTNVSCGAKPEVWSWGRKDVDGIKVWNKRSRRK